MYTFQDLLDIDPQDQQRRQAFVRSVIQQHEQSELYKTAQLADEYDRRQNRTILQYQKFLRNNLGQPVPDQYSPNYKLPSNFFNRFVVQENQYLLGNGVTWKNAETKGRLGPDFDLRLQEAGKAALVDSVSFGFWNFDHMEVLRVYSRHGSRFAPLYDEENSALSAGVQYWQVDRQKPLTAILYEPDGHSRYAWNRRKGEERVYSEVIYEKQPYIVKTRTIGTGEVFYEYRNYPAFPIVPLWGNPHHQSELTGIREQIDAYDLIKSGFANDLDNAQIYWILKNAGGMDDADLARFLRRLKALGGAAVDSGGADGAGVDPVPVQIPWESREKLLDRLKRDLYEDYMALDTQNMASGAMTATQIRAAYELINSKADQYEYCVLDFLRGILALAGIQDTPTFTRSTVINTKEEVETILQAAEYLDDETITRAILTAMGRGDLTEEVLKRKTEEDAARVNAADQEDSPEEPEEPEEPEAEHET